MATILAVDTSNNRTSLALLHADAIVHHAVCPVRDNLGWLRHEVVVALQQANLSLGALSHLAVAHGPGGLTGVRVGVGFVQALALGAGLPVVGINTLSAMALQVRERHGQLPSAGQLSVALDARMGQLYVAHWSLATAEADLLRADDRVIAPALECQQHAPTIAAGPGWEAHPSKLPASCELLPGVAPDAREVARLARWAAPVAAAELQVHYLRREVAQVPERLRQTVE